MPLRSLCITQNRGGSEGLVRNVLGDLQIIESALPTFMESSTVPSHTLAHVAGTITMNIPLFFLNLTISYAITPTFNHDYPCSSHLIAAHGAVHNRGSSSSVKHAKINSLHLKGSIRGIHSAVVTAPCDSELIN